MVNSFPQIIPLESKGVHNADIKKSTERLVRSRSSVDLSTICIIPNNGLINARVAECWLGQISQMNQRFMRLMVIGLEKYEAYNTAIQQILDNPALNKFKYVLTLEENCMPPFTGLLNLFESIEKYDVVGGLAFSPGIEGHPMIYGMPVAYPQAFLPFLPQSESIQECLAVGTGYTLYKLELFKDERIPKPWFRTSPPIIQGKKRADMPDMYFFRNIHNLGYKVACDTRVRVGTFDPKEDVIW